MSCGAQKKEWFGVSGKFQYLRENIVNKAVKTAVAVSGA